MFINASSDQARPFTLQFMTAPAFTVPGSRNSPWPKADEHRPSAGPLCVGETVRKLLVVCGINATLFSPPTLASNKSWRGQTSSLQQQETGPNDVPA